MSEPLTTVATYFSLAKLWSIIAGVFGSIIPILALADKTKVTVSNAFFMAITGSSFSIFVGPYLSQKIEISSVEGIVALSWIMGATGVFVVRSFLRWLEKRGVDVIDTMVGKVVGEPIHKDSEDQNGSSK